MFGSSPRVRGTSGSSLPAGTSPRFIPACAGNISASQDSRRESSVHPRVCGEHIVGSFNQDRSTGSSPRVRGTCINLGSHSHYRRFIPACAGNILLFYVSFSLPPVHPRVCGEHLVAVAHPHVMLGSSPRVRGTCDSGIVGVHEIRFIPACAGNICDQRWNADRDTVHPRVCGEH